MCLYASVKMSISERECVCTFVSAECAGECGPRTLLRLSLSHMT